MNLFDVNVQLLLEVFVVREIGFGNDNESKEMIVMIIYVFFSFHTDVPTWISCRHQMFINATLPSHSHSSHEQIEPHCFILNSIGLFSVLFSFSAMSKSRHSSVSAPYFALQAYRSKAISR